MAAFDCLMAVFIAIGVGDRATWLAPLWPPLFASAGVACGMYALRPRSHRWMMASGMLTVAGLFGRAAVLVVGMLRGDLAVSEMRAAVGVATWLAFGLLCGFVWSEVLRPTTGDRRRTPRR